MKATDIIKRDHEAVKELFGKWERALDDERSAITEKIFEALDTHETMEDMHFYSALKEAGSDGDNENKLTEVMEEQEELSAELTRIRETDADQNEIREMMEKVLAHATKEESQIFPIAENILDDKQLEELGEKMEKESAVANS